MNSKIKSGLKTVVFAFLGMFILYQVYLSQAKSYQSECALKGIAESDCSLIDKVLSDMNNANLWWIGLSVVLFMISNIIRSWRWQALLKPLGYEVKMYNAFFAIMIGYISNLAIPRIGEIIRAGTIAKYEDIPTEKAMGTVVTDRLVDTISLLLMIVIAIVLEYEMIINYFTKNSSFATKINGIISSPIFYIVIVVLAASSLWIFVNRKMISEKNAFFGKLYKLVGGLIDGVMSIFKLENPILFIFQSIAIWALYFTMSYVCMFAFEPTSNLGPVAGLVVFIFGGLGMVFPSPGGMGSYHFLIGESLGFYGVSGADGFSFANIIFMAISIFTNIFFGIMAFVLLPILNRKEK